MLPKGNKNAKRLTVTDFYSSQMSFYLHVSEKKKTFTKLTSEIQNSPQISRFHTPQCVTYSQLDRNYPKVHIACKPFLVCCN